MRLVPNAVRRLRDRPQAEELTDADHDRDRQQSPTVGAGAPELSPNPGGQHLRSAGHCHRTARTPRPGTAGDPRVVGLFSALSNFRTIFGGFYAKELRPLIAHHLGRPYSMRQAAYDLRRLIRKGLLERLPRCNRYWLTALGQQLILFTTKLYHRVFCRGFARRQPGYPAGPLNRAWRAYEEALDRLIVEAQIAA